MYRIFELPLVDLGGMELLMVSRYKHYAGRNPRATDEALIRNFCPRTCQPLIDNAPDLTPPANYSCLADGMLPPIDLPEQPRLASPQPSVRGIITAPESHYYLQEALLDPVSAEDLRRDVGNGFNGLQHHASDGNGRLRADTHVPFAPQPTTPRMFQSFSPTSSTSSLPSSNSSTMSAPTAQPPDSNREIATNSMPLLPSEVRDRHESHDSGYSEGSLPKATFPSSSRAVPTALPQISTGLTATSLPRPPSRVLFPSATNNRHDSGFSEPGLPGSLERPILRLRTAADWSDGYTETRVARDDERKRRPGD